MKSGIYTGALSHRRLHPRLHDFRYKVFMMYLDLDELDQIFTLSTLWSCRRFAPAWFRRSDFMGPARAGLKEAIREHIFQQTGELFSGSVRVLANLRYFGFIMNPLVVYYCFSEEGSQDGGEQLQYIVAEVTNTPWKEKHAYVLRCNPLEKMQRISFEKSLHVSPFNAMDMSYQWRSNLPDQRLQVEIVNYQAGEKVFEAHLALVREEISAASLRRRILGYPAMTLKVCAAIYWQALRLYLKGVSLVPHPKNGPTGK
jgi:uncharacterized protein